MIISSLQRIAHLMDAQHIDASPVLDVGIIDRQEQKNTQEKSYRDIFIFKMSYPTPVSST